VSSTSRPVLTFLLLSLILPSLAAAQNAAPAQPTAGFQDGGFFIQTPDGDNRFAFGMVAQLDGKFELNDTVPVSSTFTIRKLRPTFSGRVGRYFDFKVMPDFGGGQTTVADAYLDIRFSRAFRLRTGKDKTPIGHELLHGDAYVLFPERALASNLVPNRDIGFQAQGDVWGGRATYGAGVFNGIPDGTSGSTDTDSNSGKDLAARVTVQPFRKPGAPAGALTGLGLHLGGSRGKEVGTLPTFKTSFGQVFYSYATGTVADGTRTRITPAAFYYYKSFGAFGEYVRSAQAVTRGLVSRDVANHAWETTASYVLTGEAASERGVRPRNNFDPAAHHWGAVQLIARYAVLTVDDEAFAAGLAGAGASQEAHSWGIGANWYPNPWIKWYASVERTTFDTPVAPVRAAEDIIFIRGQVAF
jgi:phosphate-selective porin OprO/OprP